MVLLLQLNGDLPEFFPGHERRLYVFACRRKSCRRKDGSVRALRGVSISETASKQKRKEATKKEEQAQSAKPSINLGETLFGAKPSASSSANPFSMEGSASSHPFSISSTSATSNPFSSSALPPSALAAIPPQKPDTSRLPKTFAETLSLNNNSPKFGPLPPPEPWPQDSDLPPAYPLYYLPDADYETLDKTEELPIPTQTMELDESGGSGSGKEDKDVYESTLDKTFQKFADRLAQNPEQVIRYEFKGQPLLYSKHDAVGKLLGGGHGKNEKVMTYSGSSSGVPRCANCGAGRVFEVQLTPHAIMELESEESGLDGMEWGTIIIGVCEKDCQQKELNGAVGYVEEWAGVQWEETK